jgi:hypothetical protein
VLVSDTHITKPVHLPHTKTHSAWSTQSDAATGKQSKAGYRKQQQQQQQLAHLAHTATSAKKGLILKVATDHHAKGRADHMAW